MSEFPNPVTENANIAEELENQVKDLVDKMNLHLAKDETQEAFDLMQKMKKILKVERKSEYDENTLEQIEDFKKFYKEEFNIELDVENIKIPEKQEGFNWIIMIPKGLEINRIWEKVKERMLIYENIDKPDMLDVESIRTAKDSSYAIRVRDRIEADEEHQNKSANQIEQEKINPITLEERLILELFYGWKNIGKSAVVERYLDIINWTLCAGSRHPDGGVPRVCWDFDNRKLDVRFCRSAHADHSLRCREVIS